MSRADLELTLAIAEEGTVTRAATRLHLSQSALSHHLRSLEDRVGGPLFRRGSRLMALTHLGEALMQGARRTCAEFRRCEEGLASVTHRSRRVIRLGTECYTSYHWLPAVVGEMARINRDVELRIVIEATQRTKAALDAGEIDAVILQSAGENPRFVYWPLFRDELVLLVNAQHVLAGRRAVQPRDLVAETMVLHQVPGRKHAVIDEFLVPAKIYPTQVREVQLTEAIIEMVRAGLGVGVLARWLVEPYLRDGRIRIMRLGKLGLWRDWRLATLQEHALRSQVDQLARAFAAAVRSRVKRPKSGGAAPQSKAG